MRDSFLAGGEGGIGAEVASDRPVPVSGDHRLQRVAPLVGAVHVAGTNGAAFNVSELVEHEQRVKARAAEMAVVNRPILVAVGRAFRRIHVEDDQLRRPGKLLATRSVGVLPLRAMARDDPATAFDRIGTYICNPEWRGYTTKPKLGLEPATNQT